MRGDELAGPIRWRMHIPAPREKVYDIIDSDAGRAAFWAESAAEHEGQIEFEFSNGYRTKSKILERSRPQLFVIDYIGGPVRFELESDGAGGTDLLLTHEGMGNDEWNEVHAGWLNVLFPLKAWTAFGVDLRNHDRARSWDQGYADG
jgi:uncharacterized protein YndB with AHSA1/START domain